jgi:hypothetical protein
MISLNNREIRIRDIANSMLACLMPHDSPNPDMGQSLTFSSLLLSEFPYRDIATRDVNTSEFQNSRDPTPMNSILRYDATCTPLAPVVPHCHVTSGYRGSRIQHASVLCRREPRFSEPRLLGFLDTCPHDQRL